MPNPACACENAITMQHLILRPSPQLVMRALRRVFFDDASLKPYIQLLVDEWGKLREVCHPGWRLSNPLPLMSDEQA